MASKTYEIAFELAGKVSSSFTTSFMAATKNMQQLDNKIKELSSTQDKITRFQAINKELLNTQQKFEVTKSEVKRLADELLRADRPVQQLAEQFKQAQTQADNFKSTLTGQQEKLKSTKEEYQSTRAELARLRSEVNNTSNQTNRFNKLQGKTGNTQQRYEAARTEVKRLADELLRAENPSEALIQKFERANVRTNNLKNTLALQRTELQEMTSTLNEAGLSTSNLAEHNAVLAKQYKQTQDNANSLRESITAQQQALKNTENKYNEARAEVTRLATESKQAGKATQDLERQFEKAKTQADNLKDKLASQRNELQTLGLSMSEAGVSTRNLAQDNVKLAQELDKVTAAKERQSKLKGAIETNNAVKDKYRGQLLDAAAMATPLIIASKSAMDFESSMADVRKVVNFDTPKQFQQMSKDVLDLSTKIPIIPEEIAQIEAAAGQAGIQRKELTKFTADAAKMGVAFDTTAEESGQMMASWRIGFQLNQKQVVELADKINYLSNTAGAKAGLISDVVTRIGPLGKVAGLASGEIAALGATLISMKIPEEIAATGLKNMMLTLTAGSSATKSQQEVFKSLGLSAEQMAKKMQTNAKGAIIEVLTAIQKLPKAQQSAALSELFGKDSIGAIAPLLTNLKTLQTNFGRVADKTKYADSMEKEFEARSKTTSNALTLSENSSKKAGITIGSVLLPSIGELATKAGKAADKFADFAEKHPALTKALVYSSSAVLGLSIATIGLGYSWAVLKGAGLNVIDLCTKIGQSQVFLASKSGVATGATKLWAGAQWLLNAAMAANPIILVVAGIALLVGGLVLLYKKSETARNFMDKLWYGIKVNAGDAINFAIDRLNDLIRGLNNIPGVNIPTIKAKVNVAAIPAAKSSGTKGVADFKALDNKSRKKPGKNAIGTNNWIGGLTWINERGGEIVDLPGGTRIISHEIAMKMAERQQMLTPELLNLRFPEIQDNYNLEQANTINQGLNVPKDSSSGEIRITYSPKIIVQGGGTDVENQVERALKTGNDDLKAKLEALKKQKARLSFE